MVLFFSKKQVTLFSMLINCQSIWCNIASYSVNKNKIAWKKSDCKLRIFEWWMKIDRRWRIGFQERQSRSAGTVRRTEWTREESFDYSGSTVYQKTFVETESEAERNFADKKEKSIWDFPTKSLQNTLTVSNGGRHETRTHDLCRVKAAL